jgi:hypothetical protein
VNTQSVSADYMEYRRYLKQIIGRELQSKQNSHTAQKLTGQSPSPLASAPRGRPTRITAQWL